MKDSRCNRTVDDKDGRALEELTAEIGSAYLLAEFGLTRSRLTGLRTFFSQAMLASKKVPSPSAHSRKADLQNTTAYIQSWIKALKNDKNYIFRASKDAKTAVKYLKRFM